MLLLLEEGARIEEEDSGGWTAMIFVAKKSSVEIDARLLRQGANVHQKSITGKTALKFAVTSINVAMTNVLLEYQPEIIERM